MSKDRYGDLSSLGVNLATNFGENILRENALVKYFLRFT
jgi:hypothetical protein